MIDALDRQREENMVGYDPFGKPGAGAPNRDDKGSFFTMAIEKKLRHCEDGFDSRRNR